MVLRRCREVVEKFAKQSVRDVVITVPVFFNQAERRALVAAAEIAELNLLQVRFDFEPLFFDYLFRTSGAANFFFRFKCLLLAEVIQRMNKFSPLFFFRILLLFTFYFKHIYYLSFLLSFSC